MSQQPEQWAQEALRILGEAERWVRRMSAGGREDLTEDYSETVNEPEPMGNPEPVTEPVSMEEDPWREATDRIANGAPECELCPMCRTIRAMRTFRPDLATQLIKILDQVNREGRKIWR